MVGRGGHGEHLGSSESPREGQVPEEEPGKVWVPHTLGFCIIPVQEAESLAANGEGLGLFRN